MKKKVIVAGHICLDITPVFPEGKVKNVEQILSPGKLIQMGNADVHTGGAVANTGLAMKILGADVSLMGKVGEDAFGKMILSALDTYDATEGMICDRDSSTSYSVVLAIPGIDRIFLHHPGANHTFMVADIDFEKVKDTALFHFGYPTLMKSMFQDEGEELVHLMKSVQEAGAATSLDLAAVDANSEAGQADWKKILEKTLPYVDFFVPSIEELCFMIDREKFDELQVRAEGGDITDVLNIEQDIKPLAKKCMEMGCKVLLLKCGAKGMYLQTAEEKVLEKISPKTEISADEWAGKEIFEKSYVPEKILSGTGAGDTSIAAFLTSMLGGESPEMCLHLAAATGASCVAAYDALSGLKSLEELKRKIGEGWEKVC
ncbi:MAG: carbohydrate kinase family protein [Coprococcus comes]|nr:carbohydrate kinase family protein [Coprococcus comes]